MQSLRLSAICAAVLLLPASASAAIIGFDLTDPAGVGDDLEAGGSATISGITLNVAGTTTLGSMTGDFSANASGAGFNSDGISTGGGDAASGLDNGETLVFTFSFNPADFTSVFLSTVDLGSVGAVTDAAFVSVNGAAPVSLFTGQPDFNGSTDVWSPVGISIGTGDTLTFTAADSYVLQAISLDVTAVPEPSSMILLLAGTGLVAVRRRRKS